ncbi:MAG: 2-C-methyl-D-erythritol 2,4-cyclodiphosphate synthase [Clostridia bacterium]|nr:2-C-methyl-D-erythritol 2,4-cyclodiphosphate synthase [Clostridia bacterium]
MKDPVYVILLAGGSGSRMGAGINKVLLPLGGTPCIARSAEIFRAFADRMVLVCRPEESEAIQKAIRPLSLPFPVDFVPGGDTRQQSVANGLSALPSDGESAAMVLVHDGARCLADPALVSRVLADVTVFGSGVASVGVTDTVKETDLSGFVSRTIDRSSLRAVQTPQGFRLKDLRFAHEKAAEDGFEGTDDAALMEHAGYPVHLSEGSRRNLKLTTKEDLIMAEAFLADDSPLPPYRVGMGYDVHRLTEGRKLILCGVEVPYSLGLLGHSDADVALHALMDALLGAAGLWDIGHHFPDTDARYKGISSMLLLDQVLEALREKGFVPSNVDLTIVAQQPKLSPYIPRMVENLSRALSLPADRVNVKATTTEHLGFEGRGEGISAQAVCMIRQI